MSLKVDVARVDWIEFASVAVTASFPLDLSCLELFMHAGSDLYHSSNVSECAIHDLVSPQLA